MTQRKRPPTTTRRCARCHTVRPLTNYAAGAQFGYDRVCDICRNDYVPTKPLAEAILHWIQRIGYSEPVAFDEVLHLSPRLLFHWRTGSKATVDFARADQLLLAMDRLYFDVYNEDTVRKPVIRAVVYRSRNKTVHNKVYRIRERIAVCDYGDVGPDYAELERIRRVFEYEPVREAA
jgi:hypothetical protein